MLLKGHRWTGLTKGLARGRIEAVGRFREAGFISVVKEGDGEPIVPGWPGAPSLCLVERDEPRLCAPWVTDEAESPACLPRVLISGGSYAGGLSRVGAVVFISSFLPAGV